MIRTVAVFIIAIVCLRVIPASFAQSSEAPSEPLTRADNECYTGGTMEGRCDNGFRADGTVTEADIAWAWACGWYMARFNDGTLSRDEVRTDCSVLLPPPGTLPVAFPGSEKTPEPLTRADNECFAGGTMEGKCDNGFRADGTVMEADIAWAWACGWYMARFNDGTLSRDEVRTDCSILLPAENTALGELPEYCGVFFGGGYTICVKGNYVRQDAGNDGTFEYSWYLVPGVVAGYDGNCPPSTIYQSEINDYVLVEPAFHAWLISLGFGPYNDFCLI
jgi:hypothetical protein